MTTSVDTRVVQMQFDNASFQKGVSETLTSLENLSSKLDNNKKSFSVFGGLKTALGNLGFESVGVGLDGLLAKAGTVFGGLTNMASSFASTLLSVSAISTAVFGGGALLQAVTGGSQRATNIENAKFQIEGLKKDWTQLSDDINYAVMDTAYGFDAAAMAAAQFSASGIEAGDSMKTALRSISGVAAMTNSDYSSIASIFTTVAGQGQLMTMQLRQLEARGLNAAAILGEQMGKTEAEIRDMVTKGEIDFKTFSNAMDEAFGEHAKEANKTFTGAVSNMKAALSKIGADFIMPFHEFERQVALGFKAIFDSIRAGLELERPIYHLVESGGELTKVFAGNMSIVSTFSNNIEALGKRIMDVMTEFKQSNVMQAAVADWLYVFDAFVSGTTNIAGTFIESVFSKLTDVDTYSFAMTLRTIGQSLYVVFDKINAVVPTIVDILANLLSSFVNIGSAISSVVFPIFEALYEVFMGLADTGDSLDFDILGGLLSASQQIKEFTETLGLGAEEMANIKSLFVSVFSTIGSSIISIAGPAFGLFSNVLRFVGDAFNDLIKWIASLGGPVDNASSSIKTLTGFIGQTISAISSAIPSWQGFRDAVRGVLNFLSQMAIFEDLEFNPFDGSESKVEGFFDGLAAIIQGFANLVKQIFGDIGESIVNALGDAFTWIMDSLKALTLPDVIAMGLLPSFIAFLETLSAALMTFADKMKWANLNKLLGLTDFSSLLYRMTDTFRALSAGLKIGLILELAAALLVLAIAAKTLSEIDSVSLLKALSAIAALGWILTGTIVGIAQFVDNPKILASLSKLGGMFVGLSLGVRILASAVKGLASIDQTAMWSSVAAVAALSAVMAAMSIMMSKFSKGNFVNGAGLLLMANAMISLSLAVKILSTIPMENMGTALLGLVAMLGTMTLSLMALAQLGGKIPFAAVSMQAMSSALLELSVAILILSTIPMENMAVALFGLVGALVALVAPILLMGSIEKNLLGVAAAMLTTGLMIAALAVSLKLLSTIPMDAMITAIVGLAGAMVILASAAMIIGNAGGLAGAAAILAMAIALTLLAPAIALLSTIPIEAVGTTLLLLAGSLAVLGLAAVLIPAPAMLALAASLLAIGVGAAAAGAGAALAGIGVLAFASALGIIAVMAPLAGAGLMGLVNALVTGFMSIIGDIANLAVEGITSFAEALAKNASRLGEAGKSLILTLLRGLLQGIPEMTAVAVQLLIAMINALNQQAVDLIAAGLELIKNLLLGIASGIGDVVDAAVQAGLMFIIGVADGLRNNVAIIEAAVVDVFNTIGSVVLTLLADMLDAIGLGVTGIPGMIREQAGNMASAAEEASEAAHEQVAKACEDVTSEVDDTAGGIPDILSSKQGDVESASEGLFSVIPEEVKGMLPNLEGAADSGMGSFLSTVSGYSGEAHGVGEEVGGSEIDGIISGMDGKSGEVQSKSQEVVDNAANVNSYGAGDGVGSNFGSGTYYGIDSWVGSVASKAAEMVRKAKEAANAEQAAASPSRDMMKSGGWFAQGFMIGIMRNTAGVAAVASDMVAQAKEPFEGIAATMDSLMDGIDWDANPVITPVLDLSQVESGMGVFDGLFPQTQILSASRIRKPQPVMAFTNGQTGDKYDININLNYDATDDASALARGVARNLNSIMDMRG